MKKKITITLEWDSLDSIEYDVKQDNIDDESIKELPLVISKFVQNKEVYYKIFMLTSDAIDSCQNELITEKQRTDRLRNNEYWRNGKR